METAAFNQSQPNAGDGYNAMPASAEKSELMRAFEAAVKDSNWAYWDLLKEIVSADC